MCEHCITLLYSQSLLTYFVIVVSVMVRVMYPVERCVDLVTESQRWHDEFASDPAYAMSVFEIGRVYFGMARSLDPEMQKLVHLNNSLAPLRKRLAEPNFMATDSMIFMVIQLALVSDSFNELDNALMHLRGLHTMLQMRGGLGALAHKRSLQIKCCRSVLVLSNGGLTDPCADYVQEPTSYLPCGPVRNRFSSPTTA